MVNSFLDFITLIESSDLKNNTERTNKFNIHWQIARVDAKAIKDPKAKLEFVLAFLKTYPSVENFDRVLNWVKMTGVAYKDTTRQLYEDAARQLEGTRSNYNEEDKPNDLSKIDLKELKKVQADLKKRKYGFQFKSVPKAHTDFMNELDAEIQKRNNK